MNAYKIYAYRKMRLQIVKQRLRKRFPRLRHTETWFK